MICYCRAARRRPMPRPAPMLGATSCRSLTTPRCSDIDLPNSVLASATKRSRANPARQREATERQLVREQETRQRAWFGHQNPSELDPGTDLATSRPLWRINPQSANQVLLRRALLSHTTMNSFPTIISPL